MFLPICKKDMEKRGWDQCDFVYIVGDAYVDHPSFGHAIVSRCLEAAGYKVGIISQPDWNDLESFQILGKPRLGFLVTAGNIDSMVNHYSVNKRRRDKDNFTDEGVMGKRPDRATIVYCQKLRQIYGYDVPIIIGGIEASLRRFGHYDYWDNKVRQSILIDSGADILLYGMGENSVVETADALSAGYDVKDIMHVRGSCYKCKNIDHLYEYQLLPSYEEICSDKNKYTDAFLLEYQNSDALNADILVEPNKGWFVVANPPAFPLTQEEMDKTYSLPYERTFHPTYKYIPAIEEVQFSIVSNRGCFGACSFCALASHQGRRISSRSSDSIVKEAEKITHQKDFKGYIHDVGGPTANFYRPSCSRQEEHGTCKTKQCLDPKPCGNLRVSHEEYLNILRRVREVPGIKKVFVRSGIRYDYLMYDSDDTFFRELVQYHISGQLKVAPEHVSNKVLRYMGKCNHELYEKFRHKYTKLNEEYNKKQFLVPYLMSSHPGCTLDDAVELALYLKEIHHIPQQVQDFYPTPMTLSTCMYYTEMDPYTREPIYVAKTKQDKLYQRVLMQYTYPKNQQLVIEALKKAGREDLIGFGKHCLVKPMKNMHQDYRRPPVKKGPRR